MKTYTVDEINVINEKIEDQIQYERNSEKQKNINSTKQDKIKTKNQKKKMSILKKIIITITTLFLIGIITILLLFYGPISTFRDWWITTAMTTMSHKYLAEWFFSDETISEVLSKNVIEETDDITDTALIVIQDEKVEEEVQYQEPIYENEYEKQLLAKNLDKEKYNIYAEGEDYRIIKISGKGYSGYLAAIYKPENVKVATSKYIGTTGQYLTDISKQNDAIIAINGGGFLDENYRGNGSTPLGTVISGGKTIANNNYSMQGGLIGLDTNNKLILGRMSLAKAQSLNIRDAVSFGPYLIVNGEPAKIRGNGGWGTAPRSAIGQRKDGIILLLVLDGRRVTMPGASIKDLIQIMQNYGAYNASNLDGGTSSAMTLNHKIINDPVDASGAHRTRHIATAFVLTKGDK